MYEPGARIGLARIRVGRYSTRGAIADFELFSHDGVLVALVSEVRFKAASLVHRLKLEKASYHVAPVTRALPTESRQSGAPALEVLRRKIDASDALLSQEALASMRDNALLVELAARRIAHDTTVSDRTTAHASGEFIRPHSLGADVVCAHDDIPAQLGDHLLPPVEQIVANILDDPSWAAECVMLLNAANRGPLVEEPGAPDDAPIAGPAFHSAATIEQFQCGAPRARAQIAAAADIVAAAVGLAAPQRPFRILQLGAAGTGLTRELVPLLSDDRVRIVVADSHARRIGRLASHWQGEPCLDFVAFGEGLSELRDFAHFDLVVSVNGLSWMPGCSRILSGLPTVLADRAVVVISEREPDYFHGVVFAAADGDHALDESAVSLRNGSDMDGCTSLGRFR